MKKQPKKSLKLFLMWAAAVAPFILGSVFLYLLLPSRETQNYSSENSQIVAPKIYPRVVELSTPDTPYLPVKPKPKTNKNSASLAIQESATEGRPKIAIIIDDIGHQWPSSKRSAELSGAFTLSILPDSPFASQAADLGFKHGKEIMLHAPMEPISHRAWQGGLDQNMTEAQIKNALSNMLNKVPLATGINNHMGSAFTQNYQAMHWVMEAIGQRGLYFVDSRTSALSEGIKAAKNNAIPALKRDVFIDNSRDEHAIQIQLTKLIKKAKQKGQALGIGHPYPETLQALAALGPQLESEGIALVAVSQLLIPEKNLVLNATPPAHSDEKKL